MSTNSHFFFDSLHNPDPKTCITFGFIAAAAFVEEISARSIPPKILNFDENKEASVFEYGSLFSPTLRHRSLARRDEEADHQEEDEDKNKNEGLNFIEENKANEEDTTEEVIVAAGNGDEEFADVEKGTTEDTKGSELKRRSAIGKGLPVVGGALDGVISTGEITDEILADLFKSPQQQYQRYIP